jgi:hypothetical protein
MTKWIIFEDSASDQHAYSVKNINAIFITSTTNITVYARNPAQPNESVSDDTIALTCTANTVDAVLDILIQKITSVKIPTYTVNTNNISNVTTVAYTAGA